METLLWAGAHGNFFVPVGPSHVQNLKMITALGPIYMHKVYTCKYFAILRKYAHVSKSILTALTC